MKTTKPCCPPAPLVESAFGEDINGKPCYCFIFHTADGKRTMDLQYDTAQSRDWDALELHCLRCGTDVDPQILFQPGGAYGTKSTKPKLTLFKNPKKGS